MRKETRIAQQYADRIRRETGAAFTIVLISTGTETFVGAQVPTIEIGRQLLRNAVDSLEDGSADVTDLRLGPKEGDR